MHNVTTADGFILTLNRIPGPAGSSAHGGGKVFVLTLRSLLITAWCDNTADATTNRPAVILQHGLVDSAATWIINLAYESLGFSMWAFGKVLGGGDR